MSDPMVNVTLVHGTWARKAKWVRKDSPLCKALSHAGAHIWAFEWSGGNSHRARFRAAEKLGEHLRHERELQPAIPQAVVAHSHGGNIAVQAVWRLLEVRDGTLPVVTLATPFWFAGYKKVYPVVLGAASIGALGLSYIAFLLMVSARASNPPSRPLWFNALLLCVWVLVALQLIGLVCWLVWHGPPWSNEARARFFDRLQTPPEISGLLVIRAADDEASSTLALAQFSGWLGATLTRMSRPRSWLPVLLVFFALGFAYGLFAGQDESISWTKISVAMAVPAAIVIAVLATFNGVWLFSLVLLSIPAVFSLSQGWDGVTTSLFAFVSAEATPPGKHVVVQRPIKDAEMKGLAHSSLYDDPTVIGWVVEHICRSTTTPDLEQNRSGGAYGPTEIRWLV